MNQNEKLLEELRGYLPEYMAQKGFVVGSNGKRKIHCINPLHQDHTPSMSYHMKSQKLHCFGCGITYDIFDVIGMDYPECDSFPRQVQKACTLFDVPFPADFSRNEGTVTPQPVPYNGTQTAPTAMPIAAIPAAIPAHTEALSITIPDLTGAVMTAISKYGTGGAYFAGRGISAELCKKYHLWQDQERAYLPVFLEGKCVCWCARALQEQIIPRYKNSSGAMEIFGADLLSGQGQGGYLFVTESIFDALSIESRGFHAIALCGAGNVRKFLSLCATHPTAAKAYSWIAAGDQDAAGEQMNRSIEMGLLELGISCRKLSLPTGTKDANEALLKDPDALQRELDAAAGTDAFLYAGRSAAAAITELLDQSIRQASRKAIKTGFTKLDENLDGGLYAGLYVIGAISSLGKTSYILQIADTIAESGEDVLFFSLEMSRLELMAKSISRISWKLDQTATRQYAFTGRQILKFDLTMSAERAELFTHSIEAYKKSAGNLFLIESLMNIGAREISDAVSEHIRIRGKKPVVFVDYLQILKPTDNRATDKQNTDRAVVELKRISRDFDIPVIAVSSFNRENYRNAVSMEAFKESGAVEYSSDVLLGMQLLGAGEPGFDVNAAKLNLPRRVEVVLLKNRNGVPYAKMGYEYEARFNHFRELRWR